MVHMKNGDFSMFLAYMSVRNGLFCVMSGYTGLYQRVYSKALDFSNPKAFDKESKMRLCFCQYIVQKFLIIQDIGLIFLSYSQHYYFLYLLSYIYLYSICNTIEHKNILSITYL